MLTKNLILFKDGIQKMRIIVKIVMMKIKVTVNNEMPVKINQNKNRERRISPFPAS